VCPLSLEKSKMTFGTNENETPVGVV